MFGNYHTNQKTSVDSVLILTKCKIIRIFFLLRGQLESKTELSFRKLPMISEGEEENKPRSQCRCQAANINQEHRDRRQQRLLERSLGCDKGARQSFPRCRERTGALTLQGLQAVRLHDNAELQHQLGGALQEGGQ